MLLGQLQHTEKCELTPPGLKNPTKRTGITRMLSSIIHDSSKRLGLLSVMISLPITVHLPTRLDWIMHHQHEASPGAEAGEALCANHLPTRFTDVACTYARILRSKGGVSHRQTKKGRASGRASLFSGGHCFPVFAGCTGDPFIFKQTMTDYP